MGLDDGAHVDRRVVAAQGPLEAAPGRLGARRGRDPAGLARRPVRPVLRPPTTRRSGSTTSSAPQAMRAWAASGCRGRRRVEPGGRWRWRVRGRHGRRRSTAWRRRDGGGRGRRRPRRGGRPRCGARPAGRRPAMPARCAARRAVGWASRHVTEAEHGRHPARGLDGLPIAAVTRAAIGGGLGAIQSSSRPAGQLVEGRRRRCRTGPWSTASSRRSQPGQAADRRRPDVDLVGGGEGVGRRLRARSSEPNAQPCARSSRWRCRPPDGRVARSGIGPSRRVEVVAVQVGGVAVARAAGGGRGHQRQRRRRRDGAGRDTAVRVGQRTGVVEGRRQPPVDRQAPDQRPSRRRGGRDARRRRDGRWPSATPAARLVHLGDEVGVAAAQRGPQQVGEQGVVAVPAVVVGVGEEDARPLERRRVARRPRGRR